MMTIMNMIKQVLKNFQARFYNFLNKLLALLNNVSIGRRLNTKGLLVIKNRGEFTIGTDFSCNSGGRFNPIGGENVARFIIKKHSKLVIGNNVGISNSTLYCADRIEIEDNVLIGGGCRIWDTDFHSIDTFERTRNGDNLIVTKPIVICENSFVGGGSVILKGVRVGKNSIVGAGSVVTKDVPDDEIWGGNPAKFIRKISDD